MVNYKMKNDKYKELRRALSEGKTIQLNGTAINGGYGETWNDCSEENLFIYDISAYRVKPEKTQINYHGFKIGDVVVNKDFCEYEPFVLANEHFRGVTARNQTWFDSLEYSKMKLTIQSLIEKIGNRREDARERSPYENSSYWTGYSDALGELLEFIEDNK